MANENTAYIDSSSIREYDYLKKEITSFVSQNPNPQYNLLISTINVIIKNIIVRDVFDITKKILMIEQLENNTESDDHWTNILDLVKELLQIFDNMSDKFNKLIFKRQNNVYREILNYKDLDTIKFEINNIDENSDIDFKCVMICLEFLMDKNRQLEDRIKDKIKFYNGELKTFSEYSWYYFLSWFSMPLYGKYYNIKTGYDNFLNNNVYALRTFITNFKREVTSVKKFFEKIINKLESLKTKIEDKKEKTNLRDVRAIIENTEANAVTICLNLRCPINQ